MKKESGEDFTHLEHDDEDVDLLEFVKGFFVYLYILVVKS